jgi:hypothetical protein
VPNSGDTSKPLILYMIILYIIYMALTIQGYCQGVQSLRSSTTVASSRSHWSGHCHVERVSALYGVLDTLVLSSCTWYTFEWGFIPLSHFQLTFCQWSQQWLIIWVMIYIWPEYTWIHRYPHHAGHGSTTRISRSTLLKTRQQSSSKGPTWQNRLRRRSWMTGP